MAEVLLEKEVIFKDNLEEIFGMRPFDKATDATEKAQAKAPSHPEAAEIPTDHEITNQPEHDK